MTPRYSKGAFERLNIGIMAILFFLGRVEIGNFF
jgi:hypothetical protein